jgi:predicted transcriptional regulator
LRAGAIATIARTIGVEILFDWQGAMTAAPFAFVPGESNVLVLDRDGHVLVRASGALDPAEQRRVLDRVRAAVGPRTRVAA